MKKEIKINKLYGWSGVIGGILEIVASFNKDGRDSGFWELSHIESYLFGAHPSLYKYESYYPTPNTLEILRDEELALSITMCEIHELVEPNENY